MNTLQWLLEHVGVSVVLNPNPDKSITIKMFYRKNDEVNSMCEVVRVDPTTDCFLEKMDGWIRYVLDDMYVRCVEV